MKSVTIEFHKWAGWSAGSDLFDHAWTLGFVTILISKRRLSERLRELMDALRVLKGGE